MFSRNKRNAVLNAMGETIWGFQANLVIAATVLTVLLQSYGAGPRMIGAIAAVETAGILFPQLLGAYVFRSRKHLKRDLLLWHVAFISSFMVVMGALTWFAGSVSPTAYRWLILGTFVCYCVGVGVVIAAWVDWQADIFAQNVRGTVAGISLFGSSIAGTAGALLAGAIIRHVPSPMSYAYLYVASGVIGMISVFLFAQIDDPATRQDDVSRRPSWPELLLRFRESLTDRNFQAYLIGRIIAAFGFSIGPFVAVHYASVQGGGLRGDTIVSCGSAMTVGMALGSLVLGRLGDRRGHRLGVLIGATLQIVSLVILVFVPGLFGCLLAYFGIGACAMGTWVAHSNMVIETCPHDHRVAHISIGNLVLGSTCVLPLLAGVVAGHWGTITLFAISIVFSVLAFLWFLVKVREPRDRTEVVAGA